MGSEITFSEVLVFKRTAADSHSFPAGPGRASHQSNIVELRLTSSSTIMSLTGHVWWENVDVQLSKGRRRRGGRGGVKQPNMMHLFCAFARVFCKCPKSPQVWSGTNTGRVLRCQHFNQHKDHSSLDGAEMLNSDHTSMLQWPELLNAPYAPPYKAMLFCFCEWKK